MKVIPVIDLLDGLVVRAYKGQRDLYKPISSPLCPGSEPFDVVRQLLEITGSDTLYIADLNRIQQRGDNLTLIKSIAEHFRPYQFWLDAGLPVPDSVQNINPVLGSESCASLASLETNLHVHENLILSLDYKQHQLLGPSELLDAIEFWPRRLILMTLDAVGSGQGAEFTQLRALIQQAGDREIYAAGGVRHRQDLEQLSALGCSGALIASALHDQAISRDDIASL